MKHVLPFLMFQGQCQAALDQYVSIFPGARVASISHYGPGEHSPEGTVRQARFTLGGQTVMCIDSPPVHAFTFTPSFSFWVECDSEEELRALADRLKEGGGEMMPPGNYGFSTFFTWISDRFGVSWQLNVA